ncbi:hypothetical protein CRUP_013049 [Coryphaenoides rupestris]|nr:hypothetical protein CRUP_013049 [Coryphaenoides rupestris]
MHVRSWASKGEVPWVGPGLWWLWFLCCCWPASVRSVLLWAWRARLYSSTPSSTSTEPAALSSVEQAAIKQQQQHNVLAPDEALPTLPEPRNVLLRGGGGGPETHQSIMLVESAAEKPSMLKLSSVAVHSARPAMMGNRERDRLVDPPVYSPRMRRDMMTVKMGAELFTVSAKDTATFFRLTRPSTTVMNLEGGGGGSRSDRMYLLRKRVQKLKKYQRPR